MVISGLVSIVISFINNPYVIFIGSATLYVGY